MLSESGREAFTIDVDLRHICDFSRYFYCMNFVEKDGAHDAQGEIVNLIGKLRAERRRDLGAEADHSGKKIEKRYNVAGPHEDHEIKRAGFWNPLIHFLHDLSDKVTEKGKDTCLL